MRKRSSVIIASLSALSLIIPAGAAAAGGAGSPQKQARGADGPAGREDVARALSAALQAYADEGAGKSGGPFLLTEAEALDALRLVGERELAEELFRTHDNAECTRLISMRDDPAVRGVAMQERDAERLRKCEDAIKVRRQALETQYRERARAEVAKLPRQGQYVAFKGDLDLSPQAAHTQSARLLEVKVNDFLNVLPRDGDYYVVEGDLLMDHAEVRRYLSKAAAFRNYYKPGELVVNTSSGLEDIYHGSERRRLVYTVERTSFADEGQFGQVVELMRAAASDWQQACVECDIGFEYREQGGQADFTVRRHDAGGVYLAASFFNHQKSPRHLNLDPAFFAAGHGLDRAGLLRHHLGHMLGYRHAHTQGLVGCYADGGRRLPLSDGDAASVMQYHCAQGASSADKSFALTQDDVRQHRRQYGLPRFSYAEGAAKPADKNVLVVRYDGVKRVLENIASTLHVLLRLKLLKTRAYEAVGGETVRSVYMSQLGLPDFDESLRMFADEVNAAKLPDRPLVKGEVIRIPDDVFFNSYTQNLTLLRGSTGDTERLQKIRADWGEPYYEARDVNAELTRVKMDTYEVRLVTPTAEKLDVAYEEIRKDFSARKQLPNVTLSVEGVPHKIRTLSLSPEPLAENEARSAGGPTPPAASPTNEAVPAVIDDAQNFPDAAERLLLGYEWALGSLIEANFEKYPCGERCPEIVLVDQKVHDHQELKEVISDVWPGRESGGESVPLREIDKQTTPGGGAELFTYSKKLNVKENRDHGTYLAGIIASQPNKFGLIGVYPYVKILSVDLKHFSSDEGFTSLSDLLLNTQNELIVEGRLRIHVSASSWDYQRSDPNKATGDAKETKESNAASRFDHPLAKKIKGEKVIWVVAAGQATEELPVALRLSPQTQHWPMNLGDLENVIVVTAYRREGSGYTLLDKVNTPDENWDKMVHIAAPGSDIPGIAKPDRGRASYVRDGGTSPATALVAGVVAAMTSHWHDYYIREKYYVKTRLQVTSQPFFDAKAKVFHQAGIINPNLAIVDPEKNWLKLKPREPGAQPQHELIGDTIKWSSKFLNLKCDGVQTEVPVRTIHRVFRWDAERWIVYVQEETPDKLNIVRGVIRKMPPCKIVSEEGQPFGKELFAVVDPADRSNDKWYKLEDFDDLVLKRPYKETLRPPQ